MLPGGHSLWVAVDSLGLAVELLLSSSTDTLFGVRYFSLDTNTAESSASLLMAQQLAGSFLLCITLSFFLSRIIADRKQLLKQYGW